MEGFFKVSRQAFEHWLWKKKPFDEWHAWEYLFGMAAFAEHEVYFQREVRKLKRGQLATTYRQLARDWGWERKRVARYIKKLKSGSMIAPTNAPGCIIITICKYETYQGAQEKRPGNAPTDGPPAPRPRPGDAPVAPHDIRREEGKKGKEGEEAPPAGFEVLTEEEVTRRVDNGTLPHSHPQHPLHSFLTPIKRGRAHDA